MESLLTYGEAVGEMVLSRDGKRVVALYNASVDDVETVSYTHLLYRTVKYIVKTAYKVICNIAVG